MILHDTRVPPSLCLNCGQRLDNAAIPDSGAKPRPGIMTVCGYCGHVMTFADDLTLRAPTDAEIVAIAGNPKLLLYQQAAGLARAAMRNWRTIPIPPRMRKLDRDPRGYPIFAMAYRDRHGRAHFTVNDAEKRHALLAADRCSICGDKLFRFRWFIGGPGSAFHPNGHYLDPPMHDECAHYALQVCPHIVNPDYAKPLHGRTIPRDEPVGLIEDVNVGMFRPEVYVAVLARGQRTHVGADGSDYIAPTRPFVRIEYWRDGVRIADDEGKRISDRMMVDLEREVART